MDDENTMESNAPMITDATPNYDEMFVIKVNGIAIMYPFLTKREADHAFEGLNDSDKSDAHIITIDQHGAELLFG